MESVNQQTGEVQEIIDVSMLTATDIDLKKVEQEKALQSALQDQGFIQEQLNVLTRRQLELKKDLNELATRRHRQKEIMDKSKYNIAQIRQNIKILTAQYWQTRNGLTILPPPKHNSNGG
jgi:hypothetical protein